MRCAEIDADLVRHAELDEHVDRALHRRQVGVAAHDHPNARVAHAGDALMDTCRMRTRLTEMLAIEHPVMLAGMGGVSYQRVVAAVSDAGGFGTLGAATMSSEQLDDEMRGVRKLTDKPFGVDLLAALPERMIDDAHKVVDGRRVAVRRRARRSARRRSRCCTTATCSSRACAARCATRSPRSKPAATS